MLHGMTENTVNGMTSMYTKKTMPAKLFVPVHHQELGHIHSRWRCVAFEDGPLPIVKSLCDAGYKAAMPVWGDRVV